MATLAPSFVQQARSGRTRIRILARALFRGLAATGVVLIAWCAWRTGAIRDARAAMRLGVFAICVCLLLGSAVFLWLHPLIDDRAERSTVSLPLSPDRDRRLPRALELVREPWPAGWTRPFSPKLTSCWLAFTADTAIFWWVLDTEIGTILHVGLASRNLQAPVADERVGEILAQFRCTGPFAETEPTPRSLAERCPAARTWVALSSESIAALPIPDRPATLVDEPLSEYLAAIREHLPGVLPAGWSPPVAMHERVGDIDSSWWIIAAGDIIMVVLLIVAVDRRELTVTLFQPDGTAVPDERAPDVLRHFRGVRGFVPAAMAESDDGPRTYVGRVEEGEGGARGDAEREAPN